MGIWSVDFEFVQVNYGDGIVAGQGYVGARAVRDDQDSAGTAADVKHLINAARGGVHDYEFAGCRVGNQRELAVRREFQAIGMFGARVYRVVTLPVAVSMIETLPSPELAAQTSLSSGEMSIPSRPLPTANLVSF